MKAQTEMAIRGILGLDGDIEPRHIDDAIAVLNGTRLAVSPTSDDPTIFDFEVLSRGQVAKLLKKHVRTIDYYVKVGLLDRVYGSGTRAIGVTRESFLRLIHRRVVHFENNARRV